MYITRDIEKTVRQAARQFPAVMITGPRQSGKTTLLQHLFSKTHRYVSMDDPDTRLMANKEPALFLENYPPPLIIDELQYAPGLFSYIKILVDKRRNVKGQFLLTGSQIFPLMSKVTESLAGRMAVLTLLNLSMNEQFGPSVKSDISRLKKRVLRGGFPEVITTKNMNTRLWFSGYLQTYLERDVRQLRQIGDLTDFQRFLEIMAAFNGQVLNLSSLSRDLGVAVNTVKGWISILEASGQIITVKPFYLNKGKRIIKSPKIYFADTGLLCYILGIDSPEQIFRGAGSGQLFETMVLGEMVRYFYNRGFPPRVYWWRTSYGEEVDFIIESRDKIIPMEVKLSAKVNAAMAKGVVSFCRLFPEKTRSGGFVVSLNPGKFLLDKKVSAIPFSEIVKGNFC